MPTGHSKLGASSAYRWMTCPGSVKLSEGMPKTTSEFALQGTAAHSLAEMCLSLDTTAESLIGTAISAGYGAEAMDFEVDEDMADAVQIYLDVLSEYTSDPNCHWLFEQKFHLKDVDHDLWGTNDFCAYDKSKGVVYIVDYKHGAGVPVDVEDNKQLKYYAVGALMGMDKKSALAAEVELVIVQPRAAHKDGPVRRWRTTGKALLNEYVKELKEAAAATREPNAKLRPGGHCRFCAAQGACPALANKSMQVAQATFEVLDAAPEKRSIKFPEVSKLSTQDLADIMRFTPEIDSFLREVHRYAEQLALTGTPIEGFKLVAGRTQRKWADETEATRGLVAEFGEDILTKPDLPSVAQAEKYLKKALGNAKLVEEALAPYVDKPVGAPKLAPDSDKRKALDSSEIMAHSPFTPIEDSSDTGDFFEV